MKQSEFIKQLHELRPAYSKRELEKMVYTIFDGIYRAISGQRKVELRRFGSFSVKKTKEYNGMDPRKGKRIVVKSRYIPVFRSGISLTKFLNS